MMEEFDLPLSREPEEDVLDRIRGDRNDFRYWYPRVCDLPGIQTPETVTFRITFGDYVAICEGKPVSPAFDRVVEMLRETADTSFGYPFFLKNGLFSGKHSWSSCCNVESPDVIRERLINIFYVSMAQGVDVTLTVVGREMLRTRAPFLAFDGMPVTKERRYLVEYGRVLHHHPYWPPDSIRDPSEENWRELLADLNRITPEEVETLTALSEKVSSVMEGAWAIDWLQDKDGKWYLIDMSEAHRSYIWWDYKSEL